MTFSEFSDIFSAALHTPTILLIGIALILVTAAHLGLRWWVRRQASSGPESVGGSEPAAHRFRRWSRRGLTEVLPPLVLLLWIHGISLAGALLVRDASQFVWIGSTILAFNWAYGLAVVGALCWLLSRIGRLLEVFLLSLAAH